MVTHSNSSLLHDCDDEPQILENVYFRVILILLYTVIFISCICGNLAVILVVTLHWKMRNMTKFCLGSMAFTDLSVGIFCVYQNLSTYLFHSWFFGNFLCKMYHFVTGVCHTSSILILVVVSIERYLVLLHSFTSRRMLTLRNLVFTVLGVWLLAAIICLPRLFYYSVLPVPLSDSHSGDEICTASKSMYNSLEADSVYFVLLYVIPLGTITVLYARIAWYLRRSAEWLQEDELNVSCRRTSAVVTSNASRSSDIARTATQLTKTDNPRLIIREKARNHSSVVEETTSTSGFQYFHGNDRLPDMKDIRRISGLSFQSASTPRTSGGSATYRARRGTHSTSTGNNDLRPSCRVHGSVSRKKQRRSVVGLLVVVVLTFALLNLPFHVRTLCIHYLSSFDIASDVNTILAPLTNLLMYSNCAVNPILFAFLSKSFRSSFWDLMHCRRRRRPYAPFTLKLP